MSATARVFLACHFPHFVLDLFGRVFEKSDALATAQVEEWKPPNVFG